MTVKQKIQSAINAANNITSHEDTDLTSAVKSLIEGYGHEIIIPDSINNNCIFKIGKSTFDGKGSMLNINSGKLADDFQILTDVSLEVYYDSIYNACLAGFGRLNKDQCFFACTDKLICYSDDVNFSQSYTGKHHMVFTKSGDSKDVLLYVDGEYKEKLSLNGNLSFTSTTIISYGCWMLGPTSSPMNGTIFNFRVFNKNLTSEEILELYEFRDVIS